MSLKITQIFLLLALVAASTQWKEKFSSNSLQLSPSEIKRLVEHLKSHAYSGSANRDKSNSKNRHQPLLNNHMLNLFAQKDNDELLLQRAGDSEQGKDRMCVTGRCGCRGRGREERCGPEDDRADEESEDERNEVQQTLDELEQELEKPPLRCPGGYRCGRRCCSRSEWMNDRDDEDDEQLRCRSGRCGGANNRNEDEENDDGNELRCRHGRCGKNGKHFNLKSLEQYGKKYKINDDLDAIVVDISKFNGLLGKLSNELHDSQLNNVKLNRETNPDYLSSNYNKNAEHDGNDEVEAFVVNLDQGKGDEDLVNKILNDVLLKDTAKHVTEDPLRPNDLADFYFNKKEQIIGNALNFVKNSRGSKDITKLTIDQKLQLQKLRSRVQKLGAQLDGNEIEKEVLDIVLGDGSKSEILPHNEKNNNVYVPRWVFNAVKVARSQPRGKRLLPLTSRQKLKLDQKNRGVQRRNQENIQHFGAPFQLQIQGLGQMNP